jgi:hypothetical protein
VSVAAESVSIVTTGGVALLFAAVFAWGGRVHLLGALGLEPRSVMSFSGGMTAAYVFVHLMPELHGARAVLVDSASASLRYEGVGIYYLALIGFLCFYGLEHLRAHLSEAAESEEDERAFWVHMGGFGVYAALMSYLLVHNLEEKSNAIAFYAAAFAFHFLALDHSLRREHGDAYQRIGRWLLAGMCLLGWALGLAFELPRGVVALLLAFVSGAVIMNSLIMELPEGKDGRFLPFVAGGILYALLLLPLA